MINQKNINTTYTKLTNQFYINWNQLLGQGQFSKVYSAKKINNQLPIAVKYIQSSELIKRKMNFQRQTFMMQQLSYLSHPNLMKIYGSLNNSNGVFYFIQYCEGGSLAQRILSLTQQHILKYFQQLLSVVSYLHQNGKVHRDITPNNILFNDQNQLKLGDFGLTRNIQRKMTLGVCTPIYAAPQIINEQIYDQKCDVWSIGVVLYKMINKQQLFSSPTIQSLKKEIKKFLSKFPQNIVIPSNYSQEWKIIFQKLFGKSNLHRQSASQVKHKIKERLNASSYQKFQIKQIKESNKQNSIKFIKNIQNYIKYNYDKAELGINLVCQLVNNKQYLYIPNVYKYLLMFFAMALVISKKLELLQEIKTKKFQLVISKLQYQSIDINNLNIKLSQIQLAVQPYIENINTSLQSNGSYLKQFGHKIQKQYLNREQERKILQNYPNSLIAIKNTNNGLYQLFDQYLRLYKWISYRQMVNKTNYQLKSMSHQNLKTYMWIRIIGNINRIFPEENYMQPNYIKERVKFFHQSNQLAKKQFIQSINSN